MFTNSHDFSKLLVPQGRFVAPRCADLESVPSLGAPLLGAACEFDARTLSFLLTQNLLREEAKEKEQLKEEEDDQPVEHYCGHCEWLS